MAALVLVILSIAIRAMLLPIEFDASRRAIEALEVLNIFSESELQGARKMLNAAAFTYIATLFDVILKTLLELLILLGLGKKTEKKSI